MIKYCSIIGVLFLFAVSSMNAQIIWTEHNSAPNFDGARSVFAIDLDDDGDTDILGAASVADDITWWLCCMR